MMRAGYTPALLLKPAAGRSEDVQLFLSLWAELAFKLS